MKILITIDVFTPMVNGVVTSVINLHTQLIERRHDVRILTLLEENLGRQVENVYLNKLLENRIFMTQQWNYSSTLSN